MQLNNNDLNAFHRKKAEQIRKAASILGRIKTDKKATSSKENGKLGGRGWTKEKRMKYGNHISEKGDLQRTVEGKDFNTITGIHKF